MKKLLFRRFLVANCVLGEIPKYSSIDKNLHFARSRERNLHQKQCRSKLSDKWLLHGSVKPRFSHFSCDFLKNFQPTCTLANLWLKCGPAWNCPCNTCWQSTTVLALIWHFVMNSTRCLGDDANPKMYLHHIRKTEMPKMACTSFMAKKMELQLIFKPCSTWTAASFSLLTWSKARSLELSQNAWCPSSP